MLSPKTIFYATRSGWVANFLKLSKIASWKQNLWIYLKDNINKQISL